MADEKTVEELAESVRRTEEALELFIREQTAQKHKSGWVKHLSTIITVLVLLVTAVGAWFTNQASVSELKENHSRLENKVMKLETTTHDIELKVVQESSDLKSLKESMQEVKQDVKDIKNKLLGH